MKLQLNTRALCLCLLLCGGLLFAPSHLVYAVTNLTIAWDPNTEADLDGYGVYVSRGSSGPPYEHVNDVFLEELADPDNPQITLTAFDDGTYYFAATAFDTQGNESAFSKQLCVELSGRTIRECISSNSAAGALDAGGGGGG